MSIVGTFLIEGDKVKAPRLRMKRLKFRCIRCAVFCCKLGGPVVTVRDLVRLRAIIPRVDRMTETAYVGAVRVKVLRSKRRGECALLSEDTPNRYRCSVYEFRPDACRTYPFKLIRSGNRVSVMVLPCRGLSYEKGHLVDAGLVSRYLRFATAA